MEWASHEDTKKDQRVESALEKAAAWCICSGSLGILLKYCGEMVGAVKCVGRKAGPEGRRQGRSPGPTRQLPDGFSTWSITRTGAETLFQCQLQAELLANRFKEGESLPSGSPDVSGGAIGPVKLNANAKSQGSIQTSGVQNCGMKRGIIAIEAEAGNSRQSFRELQRSCMLWHATRIFPAGQDPRCSRCDSPGRLSEALASGTSGSRPASSVLLRESSV